MTKNEYPIGTKIKFTANKNMCLEAQKDGGKIGRIIGETSYGKVKIFLYNSVKGYNNGYTWNTDWGHIEPIGQQQLLFNFMNEVT